MRVLTILSALFFVLTALGDRKVMSPRGLLDGAFVYLGTPERAALSTREIEARFKEWSELRMKTLILTALRVREKNSFVWVSGYPEALSQLLDEAEKRGMKVYVGLVSSLDSSPDFYKGSIARDGIKDSLATAERVLKSWGRHRALRGWYLPDEPDPAQKESYAYYKALVEGLRKLSSKPILVSPYLNGQITRFTPTELARFASDFQRATGVDVQIWQDSAGVAGPNLGWARPNSPAIDRYFRALRDALGREHLWADLELFSFGGGALDGGSTSLSRLNDQLWMARPELVSKRVAWLPQEHFTPRLVAAYKAFFAFKGTFLKPREYEWISSPASEYSDSGKELFDLKTGDPRNLHDKGWVGVRGNATLKIDLGGRREIDWLSLHLLRNAKSGIELPQYMRLRCSDGAPAEGRLAEWPLERLSAKEGELVVSNPSPLRLRCRRLTIDLSNSSPWTFLSEVEIVSER